MDNTETINILSLCTGHGGLELGLSRALEGVFRVVAVEIEAYALANLATKAQEGKLVIEAMCPDLKTFPAERFRGCFDFILAGYPCQPFSVAGKRQGTDDPRHLWPHIARIVEAVRPVRCIFENVPGHLTIGFPEVYRSLRDMGYKVEAGLFTAAEVGAPHKRQRLFILAESESQRCGETRQHSLRHSIRATSTSRELANAEATERGIEEAGRSDGSQLADSDKQVLEGAEITGNSESQGQGTNQQPARYDRWPSRPGQPQYEWEEPRVVSYTSNSGRGQLLQQEQECGSSIEANIGSKSKARMERQAQSGVGRAANGSACRVDRLRLLGNGVVPQQVEKAFRELIKLFK